MQKYMWLLSYADKKCVVTKPVDENGGGGRYLNWKAKIRSRKHKIRHYVILKNLNL